MAPWIEHQPENQRVTSSIPGQGTWLGCGPGQAPSEGRVRSNHTLMFLSLSFSFPSACSKTKQIQYLKKKKKRNGFTSSSCLSLCAHWPQRTPPRGSVYRVQSNEEQVTLNNERRFIQSRMGDILGAQGIVEAKFELNKNVLNIFHNFSLEWNGCWVFLRGEVSAWRV